jgi:hypothetical protein
VIRIVAKEVSLSKYEAFTIDACEVERISTSDEYRGRAPALSYCVIDSIELFRKEEWEKRRKAARADSWGQPDRD